MDHITPEEMSRPPGGDENWLKDTEERGRQKPRRIPGGRDMVVRTIRAVPRLGLYIGVIGGIEYLDLWIYMFCGRGGRDG